MSAAVERAAVEPLAWDSEFFGVPIARLRAPRLDAAALDAALAAARAQGVRCLWTLCDADDLRGVACAQERRFRVRDVRLELARPLTPADARRDAGGRAEVHVADPAEGPALEALARAAEMPSRFFADPGFPRERCRELYAAFVRRALADPATRTTLATADATGAIVCRRDAASGTGEIELVAVAARARGGGLGHALVEAALARFAGEGLATATVVTQAANVAAQRLYQGAGFHTRHAGVWLHRWLP